ncbi:hypothetical protein QBA57_25930 [Streptomyces scabiei]|uniref:hypothetical protein n=1 Tax=Streptomyces scabiei TaxID=1930 RepID=UPI001B31148C|nr:MULTISPECIES: hypothetical protein [Streptomyces]MBP5863562.1 hypothetical protein [Streptomyces sp. LBUM 1484]MBP5875937.1 hypothetical protein [Streptomyces sp. LBUM 1477]MBP5883660.1 hypothetical protein [Streptomyces sp. LBUM 1487]MBP5899684.1 hypothetical protein [Streptomyces sp. LBUM 1488]MDW8473174.1 hypothetical protein [Streptomyces scabiei]
MIYESRDTAATTVTRPRLLPWSNPDGNPCYLVAEASRTGPLSRVADNVEAVQLGMAGDLLGHAADLLDDAKATAPQLRFLAARLTESLHDVHRIARSRGARLPVPDDDDDEVPEEDPGS